MEDGLVERIRLFALGKPSMAADIPPDSFLDLLRQSGLVPDDQMRALREEFGDSGAKAATSRSLAEELVQRGILTQWQADNLLQGKHRGFRLGPHRILRPLGQGGMSRVFLAEHELMHRRCAIKVLPSKYQEDPDLLTRFMLEARAIAALDHPHIVRAYDFNKDVRYGKEIPYLVMEYVEGHDLRRLVEEHGPLECRKAADFIRQAADGLAHAHQAGFVHRDIKPANLLVDNNGVLKVLDLGLAMFTFEGDHPWSQAESEQLAVGTADYVAPEQVADSRNVDGRADIYSLGHTFYFLLTGRRPFPKATLVELLTAHRNEQPEPISAIRPDVPLELVDIIARMTAKKPYQRFQTAKEVAEKLQAWLNNSAGGGEYSRISALMAAALSAKQQPAAGTASRSPGGESAELELAALDDEPQKAVSAKAAVKPTAEPARPALVKAVPLTGTKTSSASDSRRSSSNIRADVLAELLPKDISASSDSLPTLPAGSGKLPYAPQSWAKPRGAGRVFRSPWLWAGLVWLIFVVVLVVLLIQTLSKSNHYTDEHALPPTAPQTQPTPTPREPPPPMPVVPVVPIEPQPPAPLPQKPVEPPAEPPPAEPTPTEPTPPETPPAAPPSEPPPSPPETQPPAAKKLNPAEMLAEVKKVSLRFKSSDPDQKSTLNLTIQRQAAEALKQLGITDAEGKPPIMQIEVQVTQSADLFTVQLAALVACPIPNQVVPDNRLIIVWKLQRQIVSIPAQRIRPEQAMRALRLGAKEFFDQFIEDVRQARVQVNAPE
jgi:serine/threonine protein kinase